MGIIIDGITKTWHEAHQDMWRELSRNLGMTKDDYFKKHKIKRRIRGNCFACESCKMNCKKCPILIWRNDAKNISDFCPCAFEEEYEDIKDGLFTLWLDAMSLRKYDEACKIAKQIADLEWIEPDEPK